MYVFLGYIRDLVSFQYYSQLRKLVSNFISIELDKGLEMMKLVAAFSFRPSMGRRSNN